MKRLLSAAVALGAIFASPVLAETWVYAGTEQGTLPSGILRNSKERVVHHVDMGSVVTANGLRYFNRKVTFYKLQGDQWRYHREFAVGNSRADCSRHALMITKPDEDGEWFYRRGSGEWWSQKQINKGRRGLSSPGSVSDNEFAQKFMGFNTYSEALASEDRLKTGFYKLVCGK